MSIHDIQYVINKITDLSKQTVKDMSKLSRISYCSVAIGIIHSITILIILMFIVLATP